MIFSYQNQSRFICYYLKTKLNEIEYVSKEKYSLLNISFYKIIDFQEVIK